jgi:aminoglycoside N3'-acetyltransferase
MPMVEKRISSHNLSQRIFHRVRREAAKYVGRFLVRVDRDMLITAFRRVGLERGASVCVHSSLSRLGGVVGGAEAVIDALMAVVGTEGCVLMPSFPMVGPMVAHLDRGESFDVRRSPSRSGIITEVFRGRPGVRRSLHPTNPVAAWGRGVEAFLQGHEQSPTPYGPHTPYGRLAEVEHSYILMLETHVHSLLHHLQERVEFPNLFLPGEREAVFLDETGERRTMRTKVMRPRVPYFVAIPAARGPEPDWAVLHDFALMFPRRRVQEVRRLGYRFDGYPTLHRRRAELEKAEILRATRVGRGEIGLLQIRNFLARIEPELRELIERFRPFYDPQTIDSLRLPYS